jgi:hypothetical protein
VHDEAPAEELLAHQQPEPAGGAHHQGDARAGAARLRHDACRRPPSAGTAPTSRSPGGLPWEPRRTIDPPSPSTWTRCSMSLWSGTRARCRQALHGAPLCRPTCCSLARGDAPAPPSRPACRRCSRPYPQPPPATRRRDAAGGAGRLRRDVTWTSLPSRHLLGTARERRRGCGSGYGSGRPGRCRSRRGRGARGCTRSENSGTGTRPLGAGIASGA